MTNNYFLAISGAIIADIDHLYMMIKHKLFKLKNIIESLKYENKYDIKYKTPLMHSITGLFITSIIVLIIYNNKSDTIIFALAYLSHLLLDWIDTDEKLLLYPLKIKFNGILPIWSKPEQIATTFSLIILLFILFS